MRKRGNDDNTDRINEKSKSAHGEAGIEIERGISKKLSAPGDRMEPDPDGDTR